MDKQDITQIVNNHLCFACGACELVCPTNCIEFRIKSSGRLTPDINYVKCIHCSKCYRICPGIDEKYEINKNLNFEGSVINAYLGKSNNETIYLNSQSGGMVTEVLSYLFDEKLIKCAVVVSMQYSQFPIPKGVIIYSKDELMNYQKSIYLPVNILKVFDSIKDTDGNMAIVGVGCQIEGLTSLQRYNDIIFNKIKYKLGLICDGVLSYLSNEIFKINSSYKIIYKDKLNPNYLNANVTLETEDNKKKYIDRSIRFWLKGCITPSRCFLCYNKMNIHSDFVFGDPWGIEEYDKEKGESIVITRNMEAEKIIKDIINKKRATLKLIPYEKVLEGQQIDKRKEKVLKSITIYKKYNKKLPTYYSNLEIFNQIDKDIEQEIISFWNMENNSWEKNSKLLKIKLFIFLIKNKIKKVIKEVLK